MALRLTCCISALLAVPTAAQFDSRNVSAAEWNCTASVILRWGDLYATCGTEVRNLTSQTRPDFVMTKANASDQYTVIVVDRDATSEANPSKSPLRHFAAGNISGEALLTPGLPGSTPLPLAWFNYSGPQPPAGSGCHRYYAIVYRQDPAMPPTLAINFSNPANRLNWDFPSWAEANNLTRVASNYWTTQNDATRTNECGYVPPKSGAAGAGAGGGVVAIATAAVALAATALFGLREAAM